jgi:RNA polymerase sigma-70 factor (ECF subfamily)
VRRTALRLFGFAESREAILPPADASATVDQALRRLESAIRTLPRQLKEPLVLTMLEGLSHKQAAALLGINAKAVETRVYRAKRQLALLLDLEDVRDIGATT